MENFKNIVNILVVLYLVFAALVLFDIVGVTYYDANFTRFNPENFFYILFIIGAFIMLLKLITDLLYTAALKRERAQDHTKINKLKAEIYDLKQEVRTSTTSTTAPVKPITDPNHTLPPATEYPTMP